MKTIVEGEQIPNQQLSYLRRPKQSTTGSLHKIENEGQKYASTLKAGAAD